MAPAAAGNRDDIAGPLWHLCRGRICRGTTVATNRRSLSPRLNPVYKEKPSSAEAGEERVRAKEDIATPPQRKSVDLLQRNHDPCLGLHPTHHYLGRNVIRAETGWDRHIQLVVLEAMLQPEIPLASRGEVEHGTPSSIPTFSYRPMRLTNAKTPA
jgi:hypothetical protein